MIGLPSSKAMVKLIPVAIVPCYCGRGMHYLPTEVVVPPVVPWICCINMQKLGMVLVGVWYTKKLIDRKPHPHAPSSAVGACHDE